LILLEIRQSAEIVRMDSSEAYTSPETANQTFIA